MAGSQNSIPLDFQVPMTWMTCNLGSYWLSHQKHVRSTHVNHDFVGFSVSFWQAGLPQNCDCSHQMLLCMKYCFLHSSWTPFLVNMKFMAFMLNKLIKFPWVSYFKNRTTFHYFFWGSWKIIVPPSRRSESNHASLRRWSSQRQDVAEKMGVVYYT